MKKVLFIGNSQIGALKAGWDQILADDVLHFESYFAGVREQVFFFSKLHDSHFCFREDIADKLRSPLMFSWSNNSSSIDLSEFSKIIVAAGPSRRYLPLYVDPSKTFFPKISASLIEDVILYGRLSENFPMFRTAPVVFDLMRIFARKIIFLGAPLPSEAIKNKLICSDWRDEEILDFQGKINAACININANDNYPIFFSPQQSLCDSLMSFTKHDYMRDGLRYDGKVNGDPYHANSSYGARVIKSIARFIPR